MQDSRALHTDRYELTMLAAALDDGTARRWAAFEVFARFLPEGRDYGVVCGSERVVEAIGNFRFESPQVSWLIKEGIVDEIHRDYLLTFQFSGSVFGYPEGELYFENSPVLRVEGAFAQCVVLETLVLSILNHDTAVASTATRMVRAARGKDLIEMGSRRTHDESAVDAARAAYVGGFDATSNLEAGFRYGLPTAGTAAHAWILAHDTEFEAFVAQITSQGIGTTLLVDTYSIKEGIIYAVAAANHFDAPGPGAIRIDSGDLIVESRAARAQLDSLGATLTKIVATGDLDEERIMALVDAQAPIDSFGVGTRLVTGENCPSPGFVYKLVAIESKEGTMKSVAKRSAKKHDVGGVTHARRKPPGPGDEGRVDEVLFKVRPGDSENPTWTDPQVPLIADGVATRAEIDLVEVRAFGALRRESL